MNYDTNELYHHGVTGMEWGKRNGPPYPLNAEGKAELRQQKKEQKAQIKAEKTEAKRQKNMTRGEERLENRKKYVNTRYNIDRQATRLGMRNIKKTGELQKQIKDIKSIANEIKEDPARLEAFGKRTFAQRVTTISATAIGTGASVVAGMAVGEVAVMALPAAAVIGVGAAVYQQTKH